MHKIGSREGFLAILSRSNSDCEIIRNGLADYLEKKRGKFPRMFFLSNEELIDIFGKGPDLVEAIVSENHKGFIQNIFEGIEKIEFHEITGEVTAMVSKEGEVVPLVKPVTTRSLTADTWLSSLETHMVLSMKE